MDKKKGGIPSSYVTKSSIKGAISCEEVTI